MKILLRLLPVFLFLSACSPSPQAIQTALAQTQAANPTSTFTLAPTITLTPTLVPTATSFSGNIEATLISQGYTCKESTCTDSDATITFSDQTITMVIDPTIANGAAADREYILIENALNMLYIPSFSSFVVKDVQSAIDQSYHSNSPNTYFNDSILGCPLSITIHWNQSSTGMDRITIVLTIVEKLILKK